MSAEQELSESQEDKRPSMDESTEPADAPTKDKNTVDEAVATEVSYEQWVQRFEQVEAKAQENWEKVLRIQAEMENLKKRTQKDIENAHKFALEKFARELLVVTDSLELGIQAAIGDAPEVVKLKEGSALTLKQFEAVFAKFNIEAIDPTGQAFDPDRHQAMSMHETADSEPNTVVTVFQKGYVLNGRVIRPAMVVVAKAPEKAPEDTPKIDEQA